MQAAGESVAGSGRVVAVHCSARHEFSKQTVLGISLQEGHGVAGDAHAGSTVQHRSRAARDPSQANQRQVHLIQAELFADLARVGHEVVAGDLGENVTTIGVELTALPVGTVLSFGGARVRVTGLRNPCWQIDRFQRGLLPHVTTLDASGKPVFRAGVMAVVTGSGEVSGGDPVTVALPPLPHVPLRRV